MNFSELFSIIASLNWEGIVAILVVNWFFYHKLKKNMETLDERMFYLATGRTLADAIKDDRLKNIK